MPDYHNIVMKNKCLEKHLICNASAMFQTIATTTAQREEKTLRSQTFTAERFQQSTWRFKLAKNALVETRPKSKEKVFNSENYRMFL